jgi:hypothetical protein
MCRGATAVLPRQKRVADILKAPMLLKPYKTALARSLNSERNGAFR